MDYQQHTLAPLDRDCKWSVKQTGQREQLNLTVNTEHIRSSLPNSLAIPASFTGASSLSAALYCYIVANTCSGMCLKSLSTQWPILTGVLFGR